MEPKSKLDKLGGSVLECVNPINRRLLSPAPFATPAVRADGQESAKRG